MSAVALAILTSTRCPSLAVRAGGRTLEARLDSGRAHASDLLPALERLLAELGAAPRELSAVIVGTGPGSYTGLRVGAATALGLARGSSAVLFGLPSTEALVWGACASGEQAAVVIDARAGELYFASYRRLADSLEVLQAPSIVDAAALSELLPSATRVLADDDAVRAAGLEQRGDLRLERTAHASATAALELGLARLAREGAHDAARIEPLYLRAFAAKSRRR